MTELALKITVDSTDVEAMFHKLESRLSPGALRIFLNARAHRDLAQRAQQRFANEGDDASGPWADLAFMTGRIRAWQGFLPFHPINVRTGALRSFVINSYTVKETVGGATLTMPGEASGTLLAKFTQAQLGGGGGPRVSARPTRDEGTHGPNRPAPPRPVVALSVVDTLMISMDLLDFIRQGMF
jgi:hypothetical protein